jgi:hypothetical protein
MARVAVMDAKPLITGPEGAKFTLVQGLGGITPQGLVGSDEAQAAGRQVRERILRAVGEQSDVKRVREVALVLREFPKETLRCPEVYEYFEWLVHNRQDDAIARILRDRPTRGRGPRTNEETFFEVAAIEAIRKRDGCSVSKAAELARDENLRLRHKSAASLRNDHSRNREAYELLKQVRFLPGSQVTNREWSRPDPSTK